MPPSPTAKKPLLERAKKLAIPSGVAAIAAIAASALWLGGNLEWLERSLHDRRMRGSWNPEVSDRIQPVPVDDISTAHLRKRWPWPRPVLAELARDMTAEGARAVFLDIDYGDFTTEEDDRRFVDVISAVPSTFATFNAMEERPGAQTIERMTDDQKASLTAFEARVPVTISGAVAALPDVPVARSINVPFADFVARGPGIAISNTTEDADGVVRRVPLLWRDGSPLAVADRPRFLPSVSLMLACRWYGVAPSSIVAKPGWLILPGASAPGERVRDVAIPVDRAGKMLVNYATPGNLAVGFRSVYDIQQGLASTDPHLRPKLKDRIALVYVATSGSGDMHASPASKGVPGGLINAEALNTILTGRFIRVAPWWTGVLLMLLEAILLIASAARWTSYKLGLAALSIFVGAIVIGIDVYRITSWMLPVAPLAVFAALAGTGTVVWRTWLEDRERIDLMFTLRALQNQAMKERRAAEERPTTLGGATGSSNEATDVLKRNVEYGRFIESLRDIEKLENTYIGKHYRLLNLIDEGGMGLVFRAWDEALDRVVAIKVLTRYSAKLLKRFQTEAKAVGQLQHPNVVQVFAVAQEGDIPYIVMEYVPGTSLSQRIRDDGPLPVTQAAELLLQVARGLDAAHVRHILHRDIKTSNILLTPEGNAKIIDFGIAKFFKQGHGEDGEGLTGEKEIVGTADYMSPEQGSGRPVDQRSDIYSLGITLFRVLTGKLPFRAEDTVAVLLKQIKEPLPNIRLARQDVPEEMARIMGKMTEKVPDNRYQSCDELCRDLEAFLHVRRAAEPFPGGMKA